MNTEPNQALLDAGQELIDAGQKYWEVAHAHGISGAIIWLEDTDGRLFLFTRGEYRDQLLENVDRRGTPVHFQRTGEGGAE